MNTLHCMYVCIHHILPPFMGCMHNGKTLYSFQVAPLLLETFHKRTHMKRKKRTPWAMSNGGHSSSLCVTSSAKSVIWWWAMKWPAGCGRRSATGRPASRRAGKEDSRRQPSTVGTLSSTQTRRSFILRCSRCSTSQTTKSKVEENLACGPISALGIVGAPVSLDLVVRGCTPSGRDISVCWKVLFGWSGKRIWCASSGVFCSRPRSLLGWGMYLGFLFWDLFLVSLIVTLSPG